MTTEFYSVSSEGKLVKATDNLHVFTNGYEYFVDETLEAAHAACLKFYGLSEEDCPLEDWKQCPDHDLLKIMMDKESNPDEAPNYYAMSSAAWAAENGKGFLAGRE